MMSSRPVILLLLLLSLPLAGVMGEQETRIEYMRVKLIVSTANYALLSYDGELTAGSTAVRSLIFPLVEWNRYMASPDLGRIIVVNHSENVDLAIVNTTYYARNVLLVFKDSIKPKSSGKFSFVVNISKDIFVISKGEGGNFTLLLFVVSPNATLVKENLNVAALLPQGSLIRPSDVKNPLVAYQTPDGVMVEWSAPALIWPGPTGYQFVYITNYWVPPAKEKNTTSPPPSQPSPPVLPILSSLLVILLLLSLFLLRKGRGKGEITSTRMIEQRISSLDEDELRLLVKVAENRNGVRQKELSELVGFSKAKVSRILKKLDNMGLIKREDLRKTKVIRVEESVREVLMNRARKEQLS